MADFNQNIPQNPTSDGPRMNQGQGGLYEQITAEDEEVVIVKQKKPPHIVSIAAILMKITFHIDEFRHSNERMFIFLKTVWTSFLAGLYTCGFITLLITVFSFTQLPIYLETFLNERGIRYDSLELTDYFSKIHITNLQDTENNYQVPNIVVHSTFADFLQNRIHMVEANDLSLNIKTGEKNIFSEIDSIYKLLQIFSSPQKTGLDLKVNLVRVNNANLSIQGKNKSIPISFNLTGTYSENDQVIIPFSINESFLKLEASMSITGSPDARVIEITSSYGELALMEHTSEKLGLNATIQMQGDTFQHIEAEILLNSLNSLKIIRIILENNGQNNFKGSLLFTSGNSYNEKSISDPSTDLTLSFENASITSDGTIVTEKPIRLNLRRLTYNSTVIEGLETLLNGRLSCSVLNLSCDYRLKEKANINLTNLLFNAYGYPLQFEQGASFSILPTSKKTLTLQMANPHLKIEVPLSKIQMNGYVSNKSDNLLFSSESIDFILILGQNQTDNHFQLDIKDANYLTSDLSMNNIDALIEDYFNPTAKIQFSSQSIQTSSALLKQPISLEITNIDKQTKIKGNVLDTPITFEAQGTFNPFKYFFSGLFIIPEINLEELPLKLSEISSIFSPSLENLSGQFMAYGNIVYNTSNSILGPLYIGLRNVGLKWNELSFSGINTVSEYKSLNPLISQANQKLFIQKVETIVPVSNLFLQFQTNNQSLRLSNVSAKIAGQDVIMSPTLIPLKNPNESLALKTAGTFNLEELDPFFELSGLYLKSGKGSLNLPFHISDQGVDVKNLTLKITDGTWQKDNLEPDLLNLFTSNSTGYTVRSGQLTLEKGNLLNIALDGWLLPLKQKKTYGPENIDLTDSPFKESTPENTPQNIQTLQNQLFKIGKLE